MSDEGPDIPRRTLLYGLAAGGIGAGSGAVTAATLSDTEEFTANLFSSGEVDLETCWENMNDSSSCTPDDDDPRIELGEVSQMGDGGSGLIRVELPDDDGNNPAWVCFRTPCPEGTGGLEEKLNVTVWRDEDCDAMDDDSETVLADGSLCEVLKTLHGGILIDGDPSTSDPDPFQPGDEVCLGFNWELNTDLGMQDSVDIDFEFHATQSRSTTPQDVCSDRTCDVTCDGGGDGTGISYIEIYTDEGSGCEKRGKIELLDDYCEESGISENFIGTGIYDLHYDDDCNDTGYDVEVTDTETKTEDGKTETTAVAFEIVDSNGDPVDLCRVDIKGGQSETIYDDSSDFTGNATAGLLDVGGG
jgi:hypothetical protein